ncbi:MAG: MSMEG_1061 family FMN-dependent PPOX-type flavoprotein [Chloroflexota bacterium]
MADGTLDSVDRLREVYRAPSQTSLDKEIDHLDSHCRDFIAHAPIAVLASAGADGQVDASPKGGPSGFVAVLDDKHLALPDMTGNNRLDTMQNVVNGGCVALLFMIPGVDETLRVNGKATVSVDRAVLDACPVNGMPANVAIVVEVQTAFIRCAKALRRSGIWQPERWPDVSELPSPACMLKDHIGLDVSTEDTQRRLDASYAATTWTMAGPPRE